MSDPCCCGDEKDPMFCRVSGCDGSETCGCPACVEPDDTPDDDSFVEIAWDDADESLW